MQVLVMKNIQLVYRLRLRPMIVMKFQNFPRRTNVLYSLK